MKKKRWIVIILIVVAALAASGIVYMRQNQRNKEKKATAATVVPWDLELENEEVPEKEDGKILLPGYERMVMSANTKEQELNVGNPSDNDCYFVIVLKLADGTELFTSDYLKPGEGLKQVTINQELKTGEYQAVIEYRCYSMEDKSTLNGGSCEFTLIVQ